MNEARAVASRGGWRPWAELLRAPLLLSPLADVLAGGMLGLHVALQQRVASPLRDGSEAWLAARDSLPALGLAAVAGTCLLAAGMAQNALADRRDDALHKPDRPLPRGAVSARGVATAMLALSAIALACAAPLGGASLAVCLAVIALTAAYHGVLKRFRVPGCAALGALRGLDLMLGATAVASIAGAWRPAQDSTAWPPAGFGPAIAVAALYALFMTGASLHASTDDAPPSAATRRWSHAGLALHAAALLLLLGSPRLGHSGTLDGMAAHPASAVLAFCLAAWALLRLVRAWRVLPAGPLTGIALSGLFLFHAVVSLRHDVEGVGIAAALLVLLLFALSLLMRRAFPPT